jgi:hypothetical protein
MDAISCRLVRVEVLARRKGEGGGGYGNENGEGEGEYIPSAYRDP